MSFLNMANSGAQEFRSSLNVLAAEFVPKFKVYTHQDPVSFVSNVIDTLIKDPAAFNAQVPALTQNINSANIDEATMYKIVDTIITKCTHDRNFGYTGAKMCNVLQQNIATTKPKFLDCLLSRCQSQHTHIIQNIDTLPVENVTQFSLFLAELFTNVKISNSPLTMLTKPMHSLIRALLEKQSNLYTKNVIQILKLCGHLLDETEMSISAAGCTPLMDGIIDVLKELLVSDNTDQEVTSLLLNLIELRARNWDYEEHQLEENFSNLQVGSATASKYAGMFCDSQGNELPPEAYNFMQSDMEEQLFFEEIENSFEPYEEDNSDEYLEGKIADAYQQFLNDLDKDS